MTIVGNEGVTAVNDILGAFADTGGGEDVGAETGPALLSDELAAVVGLACHFRAGAGVEDDARAEQGESRAGRQHSPEILADLYAESETLAILEKEVGAEGNLAEAFHLHRGSGKLGGGTELAAFVKFAVVGQDALRNETEEFSALQHSGYIVQTLADDERDGGDKHTGELRCRCSKFAQTRERRLLQGGTEEEVAAGVAGEAELREEHGVRALGGGIVRAVDEEFRVARDVRHADVRDDGGESVVTEGSHGSGGWS